MSGNDERKYFCFGNKKYIWYWKCAYCGKFKECREEMSIER
jgi:hypothetical protein